MAQGRAGAFIYWTKLWTLGFIGLLTSIAFGIAWACIRDDVQGSFGIAACMMVEFTFTTGVVQAALESQWTKIGNNEKVFPRRLQLPVWWEMKSRSKGITTDLHR